MERRYSMNEFTYMDDRNFSKGRKYIGASDWPTLAGINPYQSPFEWWEVFTGRKESFKGNQQTAAGHRQEPIILGEYIKRSIINDFSDEKEGHNPDLWKLANKESNNFIVSRLWEEQIYGNYHSFTEAKLPGNKRILAHTDLLDLSGKIPVIVQAKNTGAYAANTRKRNPYKGYAKDDLSQNGIPLSVYLQQQGEMMCYGIPSCYVAVQIDGWDIKVYGPVEYRKKDAEKLVVLADRMLWHIDKDIPPDPEKWPDVLSMFPNLETHTKQTISGQDELDARKMVSQYGKYTTTINFLKRKQLDIQMALAGLASEPDLKVMHNYLCASDGSTIASFSDRAGQRRINVKKLESELPEIFTQIDEAGLVTTDNTTRSIRINGANAGSVDLYTLITFTGDDNKPKRSRKKYTKTEKTDYSKFCESVGLKIDWEKYSTK